LAAARRTRADFMARKRAGEPLTIRTRKATGDLFSTAADAFLSNHLGQWSKRTRDDNRSLVDNYATPLLSKAVTAITKDDVAETLRPIWSGPGNTRGSRLRRLIEGILNSKDVEPNPATWSALKSRLDNAIAEGENRKAMPHADVPAFLKSKGDSVEDCAGKFTTLTTVRRKEALGAQWREFDFAARMWTIPKERMKKRGKYPRVEHCVPLTDQMIALLGKPGAPDAYVFPNAKGGPLSNSHGACDKEWFPIDPKDGLPFTLHGMRAAFGTWAEENTRIWAKEGDNTEKLIDAALAHVKGDATKTAYQRSQLAEQRRPLMAAWSKFATGL
jgi:integrase